jgi:hypothetical protein
MSPSAISSASEGGSENRWEGMLSLLPQMLVGLRGDRLLSVRPPTREQA